MQVVGEVVTLVTASSDDFPYRNLPRVKTTRQAVTSVTNPVFTLSGGALP